MLLGLFLRSIIVPCDYVAQGGLVLSTLGLPFIADLDSPFRKLAALLFLEWFVWGMWRMFYFDAVTSNNAGPGIGYLLVPFLYTLLSRGIFFLREVIVRWFF